MNCKNASSGQVLFYLAFFSYLCMHVKTAAHMHLGKKKKKKKVRIWLLFPTISVHIITGIVHTAD